MENLCGSLASDIGLGVVQALSEDPKSTVLCSFPEGDWENIYNQAFVSECKVSKAVPLASTVPIVVRRVSKEFIHDSGLAETFTTGDVKQDSSECIADEFRTSDQVLIAPLHLADHISSKTSQNDFYYNWRSRCICIIKSKHGITPLSTYRSPKKTPTISLTDGWKDGKSGSQKPPSQVTNLHFPCIRDTPPIVLPHTICQDILRTRSFSQITTALSDIVGSIHTNEVSPKEWIVYHPGIAQIKKVVKGADYDYLLLDYKPFTLECLMKFSRNMLENDINKMFIVYQLIRTVQFAHDQGLIHGNITPCNILISKRLWVQVTGFTLPKTVPYLSEEDATKLHPDQRGGSLFALWHCGEVSNFDYIMALNAMAKRRAGDPNFCPVLPWVTDFTSREGKLRDLTKTKYRLTKGDEQLDHMFASDHPHHITDSLSELAYFNYKARRTPVEVLQKYVRAKYEPKEFPGTMERLYEWTPDECIPEFYTDETIFNSIHEDMPDLQIPSWASSPKDFIEQHRKILNGPEVSANIHHWIDLNFGYKLTGTEAVEAKNVALINDTVPRSHGFIQLFTIPHPPKLVKKVNSPENAEMQRTRTRSSSDITVSMSPNSRRDDSPPKPRIQSVAEPILPADLTFDEDANAEMPHDMILQFEQSFRCSIPCYRAPQPMEPDPIFLSKMEELKACDIFSLGCIIAELFSGSPAFNTSTIFQYQRDEIDPTLRNIPGFPREIVSSMMNILPSNRLPLEEVIACGVFPSYFESFYAFLAAYHSHDSQMEKLFFVQNNLKLIESLPEDGIDLLLPYILVFLKDPETQSEAIRLIEPVFIKLGSRKSLSLLGPLLLNLFDVDSPDVQSYLLSCDCISILQRYLGMDFIFQIVPHLLDAIRSPGIVAEKAEISIKYLGNRLPLVLTVHHIVYPLLQQLPKLENGVTKALLKYFVKRVGPTVVENHYIPHIMSIIQRNSTKAAQGEATILTSLSLIEDLLPQLPSKSVLKGFVLDSSQLMVLLLNASTSKVLYTLIGTLVKIAYHIGAESTTEKLVPYLDQFFSQYEHLGPEDSKEGVQAIYTPEMAAMLYYQFAILIGKDRLDEEISNVQKIQAVMKKDNRLAMYYQNLSSEEFIPVHPPQGSPSETPPKGKKGTPDSATKDDTRPGKNNIGDPNWLLSYINEPDTVNTWSGSVYFTQKAHANILKCMDVNDFESLIITGSYDNTVKLWSLDSALRFKYSYQKHKRPVHSVSFVDYRNLVASCDQNLHVWDPRTQQRILNLTHSNNFKGIQCIDNGSLIAISTHSNRFCIVDTRTARVVSEWTLPIQTIKGFKVTDDSKYGYVGSELGLMTALDFRTGVVMNQWKAHDSSILKIDQVQNSIITSSTDKTVSKWDMDGVTPTLSLKLKGYTEPVANFAYMGGSLLTSSASKLAIVSLFQENGMMQVNPSKPQNSKTDRITAMKALPLHRFFVLGTEDGFLKICA